MHSQQLNLYNNGIEINAEFCGTYLYFSKCQQMQINKIF